MQRAKPTRVEGHELQYMVYQTKAFLRMIGPLWSGRRQAAEQHEKGAHNMRRMGKILGSTRGVVVLLAVTSVIVTGCGGGDDGVTIDEPDTETETGLWTTYAGYSEDFVLAGGAPDRVQTIISINPDGRVWGSGGFRAPSDHHADVYERSYDAGDLIVTTSGRAATGFVLVIQQRLGTDTATTQTYTGTLSGNTITGTYVWEEATAGRGSGTFTATAL